MTEVLFVHQSSDLYGSDKVLYSLVTGLRNSAYHPIVLLPAPGPLYDLLLSQGVETHVIALTKLTRASLSIGGLLSLPFSLIRSMIQIRKLIGKRNIRFVYSNTLAVLSGAVYARIAGLKHLWHVHEIVVTPLATKKAFPFLLRLLADRVVCNSSLTKKWLVEEQPSLARRISTIWNGVERAGDFDPGAAALFRATVKAADDDIVVTLVGRLNRMKGQMLFVEAAEILCAAGYRKLRFAMIGSAPHGQDHFKERLSERIERSPAQGAISLLDFTQDVWPVWDGTDIAVVPSIEPESFGLVAIEAMAAGKAVVAAAHGGIMDIIEDQESGLLVSPRTPQDLAAAIARLYGDKSLRLRIGKAGQQRQAELFSLSSQIGNTIRCFDMLCAE